MHLLQSLLYSLVSELVNVAQWIELVPLLTVSILEDWITFWTWSACSLSRIYASPAPTCFDMFSCLLAKAFYSFEPLYDSKISETIPSCSNWPNPCIKTYIREKGLFFFSTMWKEFLHLWHICLVLIKSGISQSWKWHPSLDKLVSFCQNTYLQLKCGVDPDNCVYLQGFLLRRGITRFCVTLCNCGHCVPSLMNLLLY